MRQICEGVAATYEGQRMVKGQLVIYEEHCVFSGGGVTREYRWGPLEQLEARRVDVAVPNSQGQRQQPALRLSNGETAQLWMMTAELAESILRSIAQEKEIVRRVEERMAAVSAECAQLREQLARKDETIRQTSVRLQFLEEQLRAYEDTQAQEQEQTLSLMADLEAAQQRAAELQRRLDALMAGGAEPVTAAAAEAASAEEPVPADEPAPDAAAEFVPSEEPAPDAAAESVSADEPAPAAEPVQADEAADGGVSPDALMHMFQAGKPAEVCQPLLVTTLQTRLEGATAYNADGSNRQRIIRDLCRRNRLREGQELTLVPGNGGYAVMMPGDMPEQIGCLSAEDAQYVSRAEDARAFVVDVTGGEPGSFFGVTLKLQLYMPVSEAEYVLPRLGEGDGTARGAETPVEQPAAEAACPAYGGGGEGWKQSGGFGADGAAADPFGQNADSFDAHRSGADPFGRKGDSFDAPRPAADPFGGKMDKMKF